MGSTSGRIHSEFIRSLFLQDHRETDRFFVTLGVQSAQSNIGAFFHCLRSVFSSMIKSRVSSILVKTVSLRINLNLDGAPITRGLVRSLSTEPRCKVDVFIHTVMHSFFLHHPIFITQCTHPPLLVSQT